MRYGDVSGHHRSVQVSNGCLMQAAVPMTADVPGSDATTVAELLPGCINGLIEISGPAMQAETEHKVTSIRSSLTLLRQHIGWDQALARSRKSSMPRPKISRSTIRSGRRRSCVRKPP